MNKNIKKIIDSTVLNEDVPRNVQFKVITSLYNLLENDQKNDIKNYLRERANQKDSSGKRMATDALDLMGE